MYRLTTSFGVTAAAAVVAAYKGVAAATEAVGLSQENCQPVTEHCAVHTAGVAVVHVTVTALPPPQEPCAAVNAKVTTTAVPVVGLGPAGQYNPGVLDSVAVKTALTLGALAELRASAVVGLGEAVRAITTGATWITTLAARVGCTVP